MTRFIFLLCQPGPISRVTRKYCHGHDFFILGPSYAFRPYQKLPKIFTSNSGTRYFYILTKFFLFNKYKIICISTLFNEEEYNLARLTKGRAITIKPFNYRQRATCMLLAQGNLCIPILLLLVLDSI